jgi:hypothetical protein
MPFISVYFFSSLHSLFISFHFYSHFPPPPLLENVLYSLRFSNLSTVLTLLHCLVTDACSSNFLFPVSDYLLG